MRVISIVVWLFLCSCTRPDSWAVHPASSLSTEFSSSKIVHSSRDLDLEFFRLGESIDCFLIVKGTPVPAHPDHVREVLLTIKTSETRLSLPIIRHTGGQKFSVSQEGQDFIFECLEKNQSLDLSISGYQMTVHPDGFKDCYKKFSKTPFFQNPFRLPF